MRAYAAVILAISPSRESQPQSSPYATDASDASARNRHKTPGVVMRVLSSFLLIALCHGSALAGAPVTSVPEPDSYALLAIAGVAALVVAFRNRRK